MNTLLKSRITNSILNFSFRNSIGLDSLPETVKEELLAKARSISLSKKQALYTEGEPPKGIYILKKGKVKMSQLNFDGSVQILFIYSAGDMFGHRTILGNDKQPVSCIALEDCEFYFIEKDIFLNLLKESNEFSALLMKCMSHEFTILINRINVFAQRGIKERLALFLLVLNDTYKVPHQTEEASEITLNRNDLASYLGTSVENLVRTIRTLKENGYIRVNGKSIFIEDFEALYTLSGIQ